MNKVITLLSFLALFIYRSFSQPIITSAILPVKGDTIVLGLDTILQPPGNAGANVTWDFSALQQHIISSRLYLDPSATPYSAKYPDAVLARTDGAGSVYSYWKNNDSSSVYYGYVEPNVSDQNYNTLPINYYKLPIKYEDSYTDSVHATTNPGGIQGSGKYYFIADGWGTLVLPNKTVQNTLRTKSVLYIGDSTVNSYSLTKEYAWYSPGKKDALLVISSVILNGAQYKKFVFFDHSTQTGISETNSYNEISIFPNPFSDLLNMDMGVQKVAENASYRVFDVFGRLLQTKGIRNKQSVIDLKELNHGYYFIEIDMGDKTFRQKVLKY